MHKNHVNDTLCDMNEAAFAVGSSLELLATVASLPNKQSVYSSCLLALRPHTPEILRVPLVSAERRPSLAIPAHLKQNTAVKSSCLKNGVLKKCNCAALSTVARRICVRLNSLKNKMNSRSARVTVNPRSITGLISLVENDLVKLLRARTIRARRDSATKSSCQHNVTSENPPISFSESKVFVEEGTQTLASDPPTLDIDTLDPTVAISPADFRASEAQEHALILPKAESSSFNTEIEASGQLLDSFLEKVEQSEQDSMQSPSSPPLIHEAAVIIFDPKEHQLTPTFINMFWNTFPALKSDSGHVFIRLADISATALPAKDSSILKQRCNKLAIPVYSCTDLQRNFLVNYCFGSSCRSVLMIDYQAAKTLLASYCQDKMKEHGLTLNDMQVVILNEEDSQQLISSRLNLCSTKYIGNSGVIPDNLNNNNENVLVLRRRIVMAPPTPTETGRKKSLKLVASQPSTPVTEANTSVIGNNEPSRQRLWTSEQLYNASVVSMGPKIISRKRKRRAKDCFDISKTPKRRYLPSRFPTNTHSQDCSNDSTHNRKLSCIPVRYAAVLLPRSNPITVCAVEQVGTSTVSSCQTGILVPHLFVMPNAPCIQCESCHQFFSPLAFARHCGSRKLRPHFLTGDLERKAWFKFCRKLRKLNGKT